MNIRPHILESRHKRGSSTGIHGGITAYYPWVRDSSQAESIIGMHDS
ncbi:MAG: hypothetical protein ACK4KT_05035 [Thermaurantimonas sp.]